MSGPLKPTTPLTAQLERLLGTGSGGPSASNSARSSINTNAVPANGASAPQAAGGAAAVLSAQSSAHGTPRSSMSAADAPANVGTPAAADPGAALDNLFAAKFSFQFDNLQHILRYMLGEMRVQKRVAGEVAVLNSRVSSVEAGSDTTAALSQQASLCRKHNANMSLTVSRLEDRVAKEGALVNRRLGGLEVSADKLDATLAAHAAQIDALTAHVNATAKGERVAPAPGFSTLSSPAFATPSASRKDALELEGMSVQIGRFMVQAAATEAALKEKIAALEDAEQRHARQQADWEAKINFVMNEHKRITEKMAQMEDNLDQSKMNPPAAATQAAQQQQQPHQVASLVPSVHAATAKLALPAGAKLAAADGQPASGVVPAEQVVGETIDVDVDTVRSETERQIAVLEARVGPALPQTTDLSESQLSAMQARIDASVASSLNALRNELDERLSVDKEAARDHRHQVMDAVARASEAALDAQQALQQAQRVVDEAQRRTEQVAQQTANLLQSAGPPIAGGTALPADASTGVQFAFAGQEQIAGAVLTGPRVPTPQHPAQQQQQPAGAAGTQGTAAPPAGGKIVPPKLLNVTQHEFDRCRAMAELALRRTVQHSEALALIDARESGGALSASASAQASELEKLRASTNNLSARVLFSEDRLETINALTLATRQSLAALAERVDNHPTLKSVSLRVFETELKFGEIADKVALLAHLISKAPVTTGLVPGSAGQNAAGAPAARDTAAVKSSKDRPAVAIDPFNRSLVATLAAEDAQQAAAAKQSPDDSDDEDTAAAKHPPAAEPAPARKAAPAAASVEADTSSFTDAVDANAVALGMVLRSGAPTSTGIGGTQPAGETAASARMAKDLALLGSLQERLASAAALDSKLAQVDALEARVTALTELDLAERLTFIERRFTTELTFLRAHVNTKVDSASLKILLDKVELEAASSAAALAAVQQAGAAPSSPNRAASPTRRTRSGSVLLSPGGASESGGIASGDDAGDVLSPLAGVLSSPSPVGGGMMSRATSRDSRSRAAAELELRARERKQRMAHLLAMLEKKADVASIKQLEEFVRSVDRHLRTVMQSHATQIRRLEQSGGGAGTRRTAAQAQRDAEMALPPRLGGRSTTVAGYDEPEPAPNAAAAARRAERLASRGEYNDPDPDDEEEVQANVEDDDGQPITLRTRVPRQAYTPRAPLYDERDEEEDDAAQRVGFKVSGSGARVAALTAQCESLQNQIAALHAQLARKADRATDAAPGGSSAAGGASSSPSNGGVAASLDGGLTLNPSLSLVAHPQFARLQSKLGDVETQLQHAQGLLMFQARQLRNHRDWIAKHAREIAAVKEFVQASLGVQSKNAAAVGAGGQPDASAIAGGSTYPSPAVFTLLKQVESELTGVRRALRHKVDYSDLGLGAPHEATSHAAQAAAAQGYPHPTLEDLRRLLFYLTPQLQASPGAPLAGMNFGESKGVSLITTKHVPHLPPLEHTHGTGEKCMACDRAVEQVQLHASARGSARHAGFPTSLSSIAPAGGLVGANTRRLIAAANSTGHISPRVAHPSYLGTVPLGSHSAHPQHHQHVPPAGAQSSGAPIMGAPASGVNLTPRPPTSNQVTAGTNMRNAPPLQPGTKPGSSSSSSRKGTPGQILPSAGSVSPRVSAQLAESQFGAEDAAALAAEKAARKAQRREAKVAAAAAAAAAAAQSAPHQPAVAPSHTRATSRSIGEVVDAARHAQQQLEEKSPEQHA